MVFDVSIGLFMQFLGGNNFLYRLENLGFFDFILPFILIFAVIFGVLSYAKIFGDNKGIHSLIALVLGLMAIRFPLYTEFLNVISEKLAIGVVILLGVIILIGLFTTKQSNAAWGWILITVAVIILFVISFQTANYFGYPDSYTEDDLVGGLIAIAVVIGLIVVVIVSSGKDKGNNANPDHLYPLWGRSSNNN